MRKSSSGDGDGRTSSASRTEPRNWPSTPSNCRGGPRETGRLTTGPRRRMPTRDDVPSPASGTASASNTVPPSSPWPSPSPTKTCPRPIGRAPPHHDARTPEHPDTGTPGRPNTRSPRRRDDPTRRPTCRKLPSPYWIPEEHLLPDDELRAEAATRDFQRTVNRQKYLAWYTLVRKIRPQARYEITSYGFRIEILSGQETLNRIRPVVDSRGCTFVNSVTRVPDGHANPSNAIPLTGDRAFALSRISAAGVNLDDHSEFRFYQKFWDTTDGPRRRECRTTGPCSGPA